MSHFYAQIPTSARKTIASARGHKSTGIGVNAASWAGCVSTRLWHDAETDSDRFEITMEAWNGVGDRMLVASGIVGDKSTVLTYGIANGKG